MAKQYRSKGREALMLYLDSVKDQRFCVNDILDYLDGQGISMNQATVYRNIEKLCDENILIKSKKLNDDNTYYQYIANGSHCREHLHMQCKKCGKLIHMEGPEFADIIASISSEHGFIIEPSESVLIGICAKCV